jgi:hypothetical protein
MGRTGNIATEPENEKWERNGRRISKQMDETRIPKQVI